MPIVENDTDDEIEYRVNDDPPFDPPHGRPGDPGPPAFAGKKIPAKGRVEFDGNPDQTQSHFIKLHNGVFLKFLQGQPHNQEVSFRRDKHSDFCTFTLKFPPEGPPGKS